MRRRAPRRPPPRRARPPPRPRTGSGASATRCARGRPSATCCARGPPASGARRPSPKSARQSCAARRARPPRPLPSSTNGSGGSRRLYGRPTATTGPSRPRSTPCARCAPGWTRPRRAPRSFAASSPTPMPCCQGPAPRTMPPPTRPPRRQPGRQNKRGWPRPACPPPASAGSRCWASRRPSRRRS